MASTFGSARTPSFTISSAPAGRSAAGAPSSAGWKMNFTVPGRRSCTRVRILAVASRIATCVSCPHACMTPTSWPSYFEVALLANGTSTSSRTGRPSMSARRATTGPGLPPLSTAVTPVRATPVFGSRPKDLSRSATYFAVSTSRLESSGCWWRYRRHSSSSGSTAAASLSSSAASGDAPAARGGCCACTLGAAARTSRPTKVERSSRTVIRAG